MVVVGAGLSGLVAATEVLELGLSVRVLEARDRVGGLTWSHPLPDGSMIEMGGQWIGPGQVHVNQLVRELGLATTPTPTAGRSLRQVDGVILTNNESGTDNGTKGAWSAPELADIEQSILRLEELAARVAPDAPWLTPGVEQLDGCTFREWLEKACQTDAARDLLSNVVGICWGTEVHTISLLHFLVGLASTGGSFERMTGVADGAQQDRIVGGSQLLSVKLAERLGSRVELSSPVRCIVQDADGVDVHADGLSVRASQVVVSLPPALAGRLQFEPPLAAGRDQLTQRVPLCNLTKVNVVYARPFWRDAGLSGQFVTASGPVSLTFDNSVPGSDLGVLVGFIEGAEAVRFGCLELADRKSMVIAQLVSVFGTEAADAIEYLEVDWSKEAWSRGAHQSLFGPGTWTGVGSYLTAPEGRIHWAGAATASEWACYMEGAVSSGRRAAREVAEALQVIDVAAEAIAVR